MTRVLGLDLSITATGVCLPDGRAYTIRTDAKHKDGRLTTIRDHVHAEAAQADLAVIEDLPTHARAAGITGMVHGAVRTALLDLKVPYVLITPATLKAYATGKGNADKTAMALAAFKRADLEFADDNQCDAWWLRSMGMDWYGFSELLLPMSQRDRMKKAEWPSLARDETAPFHGLAASPMTPTLSQLLDGAQR